MDVAGHLAMCDTEVISAMRAASQDTSSPAHIPARRIMRSEHFRAVADFNAADRLADPGAAAHLASLLRSKFGEEALELDDYTRKTSGARFPVLTQDNKIEWSTLISATLNQVPTFSVQYVFVEPSIVAAAKPDVAQFRMLAPV